MTPDTLPKNVQYLYLVEEKLLIVNFFVKINF